MAKVWVEHSGYGCESGCCGHVVVTEDEAGEERQVGRFAFDHPMHQTPLEFAKELVTDEYGAEHVADLDWERCVVVDD